MTLLRDQRIRLMRESGCTFREIAETFDLSRSRVGEIIRDPGRAGAKARKAKLAPVCIDCGKTRAYDGRNGSVRCARCDGARRKLWTREVIIERIQAWVDCYGVIPSALDWNPAHALSSGRPDRADRFYGDGCWPHLSTVHMEFGSWNNAILAAGYEPRTRRGKMVPLAVSAYAQEREWTP